VLILADLIEALTGERIPAASRLVTDAVIDSRMAVPGALFIALKGSRKDGHDYVEEAFKNGAHLAFVERDVPGHLNILDIRVPINWDEQKHLIEGHAPLCLYVDNCLVALQTCAGFWRKKLNLRVVGVTGSVGKSTTKEVVAEVLSRRFRTLRSSGNMNNEIGLPLTLLKLTESHTRAVLEMGFYVPGEISFLCNLALPQVGVVTNVGTVHAERAGSREAIARGKSELIQALPPDPEGIAILNYDDPWVRDMSALTQAKVFYYGLDPQAHLWADNVEGLGLEGVRFRLHFRNETLYMKVPMIGRHSVHTALRAAAVGLVEGLTWQEIMEGLRSGKSQLRLVVEHTTSGAMILDDTYNASPESMLAALNLLEELGGHKIAVLGDMLELGPYERRGHAIVGLRAAEVVDELVTIGERGKQIAAAAQLGGLPVSLINQFEDVDTASQYLSNHITSQDVVLIKGSRGMQMDRIVSALEEPA
jgi:UDP-N-acetylmuramoyl-tripeptide--D-alanyl-D-alanine ligase